MQKKHRSMAKNGINGGSSSMRRRKKQHHHGVASGIENIARKASV